MRFFNDFNRRFAIDLLAYLFVDGNPAQTPIKVYCIFRLPMFLIMYKLLRSRRFLTVAAFILGLSIELFRCHFTKFPDSMRKFEYLALITVVLLMLNSHHQFAPKNKEQIPVHVTRQVNYRVCRIVFEFNVLNKFICIGGVELYIKNVFFKPRKLLNQLTKFLEFMQLPRKRLWV